MRVAPPSSVEHSPPPAAHGLQAALVGALAKHGLAGLLLLLARRLLALCCCLQSVCLLLVWLLLSRVGEHNVTTAFLLYLPPALWFLPCALLLPPALLCARRAGLLLLLVTAALLPGWLQLRLTSQDWTAPPAAGTLTVLTYNRGQQGSQSLQPFKNLARPDVMVLQDAGSRAERYLQSEGYTEFSDASSVGEHTLVSRHPIVEAAAQGARAARFVIDWQGTRVAVYSVHFYTPRHALQALQGGGFLYGVLGLPGTPLAEGRRQRQQFWDAQLADARDLLAAVRGETLPFIVAGDFNAPHVGRLYRLLAAEWTDAHAAAGRGFGMTFPGETRNPLSAGGPWLRIDYLFAGAGWQVDACVTEPERASQHRALAARFRRSASAADAPARPSGS